DELLNDVTVYLDKESATTIEALNENQLFLLGHKMLEDAFMQLAAPITCSLHLIRQFFDADLTQFETDDSYFIGDYWDDKHGYWIARSYLDLFYDEQTRPILTGGSWLSDWVQEYQPPRSMLLGLANTFSLEEFLHAILETPTYDDLTIRTIEIDELAHDQQRCVVRVSWSRLPLERNEFGIIGLGYQLFSYLLRYYGDTVSRLWLKIIQWDSELVSFEKREDRYWYSSWLDNESTRFELDEPVVFNGRAKREFKDYLQQQLLQGRSYLTLHDFTVRDKVGWLVAMTVESTLDAWLKARNDLFDEMERLIWDVFTYYQQPPWCVLKIQTKKWHLTVRLEQVDHGYFLERLTEETGPNRSLLRDKPKEDAVFLTKRFKHDWNQYRYLYHSLQTA
ncbi:MAG: hypothetical protein KDE51_05875, partial [Anaerolineales bacterium]|nr:hypothetical protein [Anaerolineales bacterium]